MTTDPMTPRAPASERRETEALCEEPDCGARPHRLVIESHDFSGQSSPAKLLDLAREARRAPLDDGHYRVDGGTWEAILAYLRASYQPAPEPDPLVTIVCDLLWEYGVYLKDSTPLSEAIVAALEGAKP
jgi:hypothetical protein